MKNVMYVKGDPRSDEVLFRYLKDKDYVVQAYDVTGTIDYIIIIEAETLGKLNGYVDEIRKIPGVLHTESGPIMGQLRESGKD